MNARGVGAKRFTWGLLALVALAALGGCSPNNDYQTGDSQTNWLRQCHSDDQCGDLQCLCGVCTRACTGADSCGDMPGAECVSASEAGATAQCSGSQPPVAGLCMRLCDTGSCASDQMCVAGVCTPALEPTASVSVDTSVRHQALVGFGASVAYGESELTSHPEHAAIYQAIFQDLGLDLLRFRNRYEHSGDDDLSTTAAIFNGASAALGHAPVVFLGSWSPPPALKANGSLTCSGNAQTCTLSRASDGGFDYAGLASYWLASLGAYAAIGITPDYVGLQNNPDWIPSSAEIGEACKFLPTEGASTVSVDGSDVSVSYPGYAEAQAATLAAFARLPAQPKIVAPETSDFSVLANYAETLDFSRTTALAHQFYGVNPNAVDVSALEALASLQARYQRPLFVTEMEADGFGTALSIHYATAVEGASAYLQTALMGALTGVSANTQALLGLDFSTFGPEEPYYAMRHFAHDTEPGWVRVDATSTGDGLLSSAWISPQADALSVILINASSVAQSVTLNLAENWPNSSVVRSVFSGVERAASLGPLPARGLVELPPQAVVTVSLTR